MKPDFIIIGAMKCATTTLHDQLAAQHGVFMSTPKEPNFFSDPEQWERGLSWYEDLFGAAKPGEIKGESSTHYTKLPTYPQAAERIAEHVPEAKLVYVMRHPIDRLVSHYIHEWTQREIETDLETALGTHPELVEYGRYWTQLAPYLERFGRERILPLSFDRLRADPQAVLEQTCAFIGLSGTPRWRKDLGASNVSGQRMRASRWRDALVNAPVLSTVRQRVVPQWMRDRIKQLWMMKGRPQLSAERREELRRTFDPELEELGAALGIDGLRCESFVALTRERELRWGV